MFPSIRQEALLAAISEKDANIARLEEDQTNENELNRLYDEKDGLHHQLKELVSHNNCKY